MTQVLTSVNPHCHRPAPQPPKITTWASDLALLVTVQVTTCFPSLHLGTDRCISAGGPRSTDHEKPALSHVCTSVHVCACMCRGDGAYTSTSNSKPRPSSCFPHHRDQSCAPQLERSPRSALQLEKSPYSNEDPAQPKINK